MKNFNNTSAIDELVKSSLDKIKTLVETNTIVGDSISVDASTTIIPISKATVGFIVGGGEYSDLSNKRVANHYPMAGGSGCGMSVSPIGFIVICNNDVKFVDIENKTLYQTVVNLINKIVSKIGNNEGVADEKDL